jgi:hypothetical protein
VFREIDNGDKLAGMKDIVDGWIEHIPIEAWFLALEGTKIDLYANEEAKLQPGWQERINFILPHPDTGETHDVTSGNVFFCSHDDEGESLSITDKQVQQLCELMEWPVPEAA